MITKILIKVINPQDFNQKLKTRLYMTYDW